MQLRALQVFDLNGMMGVHLEVSAYLNSHLELICSLSQEEEPPASETGIIGEFSYAVKSPYDLAKSYHKGSFCRY